MKSKDTPYEIRRILRSKQTLSSIVIFSQEQSLATNATSKKEENCLIVLVLVYKYEAFSLVEL